MPTVLLAALIAGCQGQQPVSTIEQRLQSRDPDVRIGAIREAGDRKDQAAVPFLVDRLGDSDADVRLFAGMALQRITGQTMGWRFYDSRVQRDAAIQRWRDWLNRGRKAAATTQAATEGL